MYMLNTTQLVYMTTLLDTYITDTTRFLLFMFPQALGRSQSVTMEAVLSKSRTDLLQEAVTKKAREISYLPFVGRMSYLRDTFGLTMTLEEQTIQALEHYSGIRNVVIHDQSLHSLKLSKHGKVGATRKTDGAHPTPVSDEQLEEAQNAFWSVAIEITRTVAHQVLRARHHPTLESVIQKLEEARDLDTA